MRQLASIQKIDGIYEHPNADKLDIAQVGGWKSIVRKDEFKVGDVVVYLEIDAWVPHSIAPFLSKNQPPREYMGVQGERLKTMKLRGVLSQGLILPLDSLSVVGYKWKLSDDGVQLIESHTSDSHKYSLGSDITELIGVLKWEPSDTATLDGTFKSSFPQFIRKSDQDRIQNSWTHLIQSAEYLDMRWEMTTKLDGSSMTVYQRDGEFGVCSRERDLVEDTVNTYWKVAIQSEMREKLQRLGMNIALQGELMGEGIQSNLEKIKGHQFYLYDIFLIDVGRYATILERTEIMFKLNSFTNNPIEHVPFLGYLPSISEYPTLDDFMQFCESIGDGRSLNALTREGVVFKSTTLDELGEIKSFKVISNKYLLKND